MNKRAQMLRVSAAVLLALSAATQTIRAEDAAYQANVIEKPWKFEFGGRRDPFNFGAIVNPHVIACEFPPKVKDPIPPATYFAEATSAFLERNRDEKLSEALAKCDASLKALAEDPNTLGDPRAQDLREQLIDLRKAAQGVAQRKNAERKFNTIPLRLTGIVRRDSGSQAIVNSRTVRKGDVVADANDSIVYVEEIRADGVVVVFEGYRMLLNLSEAAK